MDPQTLSEYADHIRWLSNGGDGAGATATCTLAAVGNVRSFTIHTAGTGYSEGDVLTCNGATFNVTEVDDDDGAVLSATILTGGTTIVDASNVATTVSPAGGTGCRLNLVAQFPIATVTIGNAGADYITAWAYITGGNGSGGEIVFSISGNSDINGATVVHAGNYRTAPTLQVIAGGPETGSDFRTALTAYDTTQRNKRLLDILGQIERTVVLNPKSIATFESMRQLIIDSV